MFQPTYQLMAPGTGTVLQGTYCRLTFLALVDAGFFADCYDRVAGTRTGLIFGRSELWI